MRMLTLKIVSSRSRNLTRVVHVVVRAEVSSGLWEFGVRRSILSDLGIFCEVISDPYAAFSFLHTHNTWHTYMQI